jgi:hypothetical protein
MIIYKSSNANSLSATKIIPYFSDDWPLLFSSEEHTAANTTNAANLLFFFMKF